LHEGLPADCSQRGWVGIRRWEDFYDETEVLTWGVLTWEELLDR
jgi:hypothetical protein